MSLKDGQTVTAEISGATLNVKKKLGEGGQGAVFFVEGANEKFALKWYNVEQSTEDQKSAIRYLVQHGPLKGKAGQRFIWPLDLVTSSGSPQFGYLMPLIDTGRFAELGEVQAHLKPAPGFRALCEISYQAANSYRALHLDGHCYRDISAGNLMFDPMTGDVLICDNDNVGVNRQSKCQVWGTMEYMAPELILGKADPSTETDLHSLAVLLFQLWVWHHPLHGQMEYDIRSWDLPAKRRVYGESPIFIFHPTDTRNQLPNDPAYATAGKRWGYCPRALQETFQRAFTVGLTSPAKRVTEGEWQSLFIQMKDLILSCPHDSAENIIDPDTTDVRCWHCGNRLRVPPKLVLTGATGRHCLLLDKAAQVRRRHIDPHVDEQTETETAGEVVQNPKDPSVWGIRNLTGSSWHASFPDGTTKEVPPQRAAPLIPGLKIDFGTASGEITA